jgi:ABC-type Fe3+-hydroxamate transport system substrate-binding protein
VTAPSTTARRLIAMRVSRTSTTISSSTDGSSVPRTPRRGLWPVCERVAAVEERFRDGGGVPDHLSAYGQASISQVQLETLGLTNTFAEVEKRFIELNAEELLARDPDVLVLAHGHNVTADAAMQQLRGAPGAERLTAVREGHIIPVEGQAILGGIQPIEALDGMADTLAALE